MTQRAKRVSEMIKGILDSISTVDLRNASFANIKNRKQKF